MQSFQFKNPNKVKNLLVRLRLKSGNAKSASPIQAIEPMPVVVLFPPTSPIKLPKPTNKIEQDYNDFERLRLRLLKRFKAKGLNTAMIAKQPAVKLKGGIMDNIGKIFDCNQSAINTPRANRTIVQSIN